MSGKLLSAAWALSAHVRAVSRDSSTPVVDRNQFGGPVAGRGADGVVEERAQLVAGRRVGQGPDDG